MGAWANASFTHAQAIKAIARDNAKGRCITASSSPGRTSRREDRLARLRPDGSGTNSAILLVMKGVGHDHAFELREGHVILIEPARQPGSPRRQGVDMTCLPRWPERCSWNRA